MIIILRHSVQKFAVEALGASAVSSNVFSFIPIDGLGPVQVYPHADANIRCWTETKTQPPSLPPSFGWRLYVVVSSPGLPVDLWSWQHATVFDFPGSFDSLQAGKRPLHCLKLDQRRRCLKSGRPAGRRSEETQSLARAIVRYTVAAGSHNFSLCVVFLYCSPLPLLSSAQSVEWLS